MRRLFPTGLGILVLLLVSPVDAFFSYTPNKANSKRKCLKKCLKKCKIVHKRSCHSKRSSKSRHLCQKKVRKICATYCPKRCIHNGQYCRAFKRLQKHCKRHLHWQKVCKRVRRSSRYCRSYNAYYKQCKRSKWKTRFCRRWYHLRRLCSRWHYKSRICLKMKPRIRSCLRRARRFRKCKHYKRWSRLWK